MSLQLPWFHNPKPDETGPDSREARTRLQQADPKPASPAPQRWLRPRPTHEKHQGAEARMQVNLKVRVKMAAGAHRHTGCTRGMLALLTELNRTRVRRERTTQRHLPRVWTWTWNQCGAARPGPARPLLSAGLISRQKAELCSLRFLTTAASAPALNQSAAACENTSAAIYIPFQTQMCNWH